MSDRSRHSDQEDGETERIEEVVEEREFRSMTSLNPQPSLTEALLAEMTQQMQRQSEQMSMQAEQMQRFHVEQSRALERRLSDIAVSQHEVMTSVMDRLERVEAMRPEGTNPDLWTARPEVSSYCDLAPFIRAPLSLSSPPYSHPSSFVHHHQIETVAPLRRSLRLRDKARTAFRRIERPEFLESLPPSRVEGTTEYRMDFEVRKPTSLNLQKNDCSVALPQGELASTLATAGITIGDEDGIRMASDTVWQETRPSFLSVDVARKNETLVELTDLRESPAMRGHSIVRDICEPRRIANAEIDVGQFQIEPLNFRPSVDSPITGGRTTSLRSTFERDAAGVERRTTDDGRQGLMSGQPTETPRLQVIEEAGATAGTPTVGPSHLNQRGSPGNVVGAARKTMASSQTTGTYTTVPTLRTGLGPWIPSARVQDPALFGGMSYSGTSDFRPSARSMCTGMEPRTSITPYHVNRPRVNFAELDDVGCRPAMRYTTATGGPGVYGGWIPQPGTASVLPLASHPPYLEPAWRPELGHWSLCREGPPVAAQLVPALPKVSTATQTNDDGPPPKTPIVREVEDGPLNVLGTESRSTPTGDRPRSYIKLDKYSGQGPLQSFLSRFELCSRHNAWSASERLTQLACALSDGASQLIWEAQSGGIDTAEKLIQRLQERYGSHDRQAVFRAQLLARRQKQGEDLPSLFGDIQRLLVLAYPGESAHSETMAIHFYIAALEDRELALKVSEREPTSLQQAFTLSLRLQAYKQAENDNSRDSGRNRGRVNAVEARDENGVLKAEVAKLKRTVEELKRERNQKGAKPGNNQAQVRPAQGQPYDQPPWNQPRGEVPQGGQFHDGGHQPCQQCGSLEHRVCTRPYQGGNFRGRAQGHNGQGQPKGMAQWNNGPGPQGVDQAPVYSRYVPGSESAYLKAKVNGKEAYALLDSGSQTSLCSEKYVRPKDIRPSNQSLLAANGTRITVSGETVLTLKVDGMIFKVPTLVTPQLDGLILGLNWMNSQALVWRFGQGWLELCGRRVKVHIRPDAGLCRRVVAAQDVLVPPLSEMEVEAYAVLPNFNRTDPCWATRATMLDTGLVLAGSLLPQRTTDLTLRVLNPTGQAIKLRKGVRCDAEAVEVLGEKEAVDETSTCAQVSQTAPVDEEAVLEPLWDGIADDVPAAVQEKLKELLLKYKGAFSLSEYDLGYTDILQHEIYTGTEAPVRQALRRQPLLQLPIIDEQVDTMLEQGLIERSCSEWASNVVIVTKKDGTPRFCVDYRQLNNKTRKDAYPLPLISECLDTLGGASWFSTFDLRAGYHQVALHPRDRHKTAFVTRGGSFQFRVLPFGLCGSPASFSRLMGLVMAGLNFSICLIYLDDIIVFSKDLETHLQRLELVLERLVAVNLKLKPSKCHLLQKRVLFLGHIVSQEGIETDPRKIEAVRSWPTPTKLKEVRAFMGLCSYYRKFVPQFAHVGRPLHALTRKDVRFNWTHECDEAFEQLKTALTEAPVLALPLDEGQFVLDTDASGEAIGAVLSQVQEGVERVICYGSRVCSLPEQNYDVTRRELLAIIYFLKLYRPYLLGRRFLLRTDHSALQWLRRTPLPIGQQARWLTTIEEFDFEVKHRAGASHQNADAMSRRPHVIRVLRADQPDPVNTESATEPWSRAEVAKEQADDPELGWIIGKLKESEDVPSAQETKRQSAVIKLLVAQWPQLKLLDELLVRSWLDAEDSSVRWEQIVLPKSRRTELIQRSHEGMTGGHLGLKRTYVQVQRRAYWPNWREDVRLQLARCETCARYFRGKPVHQAPLQNMVVGEIGEVLALDLTGPHVTSSQGHKYILTMIDHFSRWAEAFPVRNQEAHTVARVLVDQWISRYGCPLQILTDQGPCFESALFADLCKMLDVSKVRTSPYKPSTNGMIERFHRTLNALLAKFVASNHRNWHEMLPVVMSAYRSSQHASTGYSPNKLFLNRELYMPLDLVLGDCQDRPPTTTWYHEYVQDKRDQISATYALARNCMQKQAELRAKKYDLRVKTKEFSIGSFVWYYYPRKRAGLKEKWLNFYVGPFRIEGRVGPVLYQVRKTPRSKAQLVYVDKLKAYSGPIPLAWGGPNLGEEKEVPDLEEEEVAESHLDLSRPKRAIRGPVRYGFET